MSAVAALCTAMALILVRPPGGWLTRERLDLPRVSLGTRRHVVVPLGVASVLGVLVAGLAAAQTVVAATVGGVGWFAAWQIRAERGRRAAQRRRQAVAEAVGLMAAELRAGVLPRQVLAGLAADFDFLAAASRAAELGGDVSSALRQEAGEPGCELLAELSSAWMVADRAGAPLSRVLDRLEASARDDREIEREVQAGVAPARATGRLMAVLPIVGLTLGSGAGSNPVKMLIETVPGALCLAAGSTLACAGVAWVNRIAAAAERTR